MMFQKIIFCVIFELINGDMESNIRNDEQKRHNATVSSYLKAAFGGALDNLFPKVSDQEIEEANKLLADVFPLGDPLRPMADSEEKIETNLCKNHRERGEKVLTYSRKRWPTNLITQVSIRLSIHSIGEKNDWYCLNAVNRNIYISNASVINSHINALIIPQNKFIDNNLVAVHGNSTIHRLAVVCCSYWSLKTDSVNAVPEPNTKHFIADYINGYAGSAVKYLCVYHSEGSKVCADLVIPPPPSNIQRSTSLYAASVETLSKITSLSP